MSPRVPFHDYLATLNELTQRGIIPLDTEYRHDRLATAYIALASQTDLVAAARIIGGEDLAERVQDEWPKEWRDIRHGGWSLTWRERVQR